MATAEVTVLGAGIFGLTTAFACAKSGARVRVIEAMGIGAGSSGWVVGALAPHVREQWIPKKQFQLESLLMAEEFWADVAAAGGEDPGYARLGRLQPLADAAAVDLARTRAEGAGALWQDRALWQVEPVREGWGPVSPTGHVIHDTLTARLSPRHAAVALVAAIRALGGEVVVGDAPVEGAVVHATGVEGLAELSAALGHPVGGAVKGQAAVLRFDARDQPQIFADGLHIVPHGDGTVAIGSTSENQWQEAHATDDQLQALIDRARLVCPMLADAPVIERWAGLRPRARSRAPMLGAWPGRTGHYIAHGGFKIGFGMAPKVAEVMAGLVLSGRDAIPEGFRVEGSL